MNFPLRSLAVLASASLCLPACFAASPGQAPQQEARAEKSPSSPSTETIVVPGPLRPFLRMSGISQEVPPEELLPLLARQVFLRGFEEGKPTEFLMLIDRYVRLARELQSLAGADGVIRVAGCDEAATLIQILGYKFEKGCGPSGAYLVTANAGRAFLTIDSGFPLTALEDALQKRTSFAFEFPSTRVPVLLSERDWTALGARKEEDRKDLLDVLLRDIDVDRLYTALAKIDRETRTALVRSVGMRSLLTYAAELDQYGSRISIRGGQVSVPAGPGAEHSWQELAGASPYSPKEFVTHLLEKDHGWLVAYFDALSRVSPEQQTHFAESDRLKLLYEAFRPDSHKTGDIRATAGFFPRNTGLLVLLTRLHWTADGEPQVPGNLEFWKEVLTRRSRSNSIRAWATNNGAWNTPEKLLEALVASTRIDSKAAPSRVYLMMSAIDEGRPSGGKLSEEAVRSLVDKYPDLNSWYPIFAEFPALDDQSISRFVATAERIDTTQSSTLRSNALGAFQANVGLWQILARQGQISGRDLNRSWQSAVQPFSGIGTSVQLFEATRASLESILFAASGTAHLSQNQVVELLAGPTQDSQDGRYVHEELARRIRAVFEDQRLVSLDTLFGLFDGLGEMAKGAAVADNLLPLAADLHEFELPRPIFTGGEKAVWAPIVYVNRHAELQVRTDLTRVIRSPGSPTQLADARGRLTPFLRDTLVGLNYAYYEPPGAQVLHNNPLFVRSHDFSGASIQGVEHIWDSPTLIGVGVTAGGGAYLLGSLADLPYALASMEQDFISPRNVQALIWREVVPELLVVSVLPRWWNISRDEMHAATLYQRFGEELLIASASNPQLQEKVLSIFAERLSPARMEQTSQSLQHPESAAALASLMLPTETFFLASEFRNKFPDEAPHWGSAGRELEDLARKDPSHVSWERLSKDFGMPHPAMAQSPACALLNSGILPYSGAFEGRLFGESWESSNLYWARLADEKGYSPVMLNILVPDLTRHMVANIFATDTDDWQALLRAMEETGDQFRQGKITLRAAIAEARQTGNPPIAEELVRDR
jgi:hypothetical protein